MFSDIYDQFSETEELGLSGDKINGNANLAVLKKEDPADPSTVLMPRDE